MRQKENQAVPESYPKGFGIEWHTKRSFGLGGHEFNTLEDGNDYFSTKDPEQEGRLLMAKSSIIIHQLMALVREQKPKNIVELGIYRGGSAAFLYLLAKPMKMLALDLSKNRLEKLDHFIAVEKAQDILRVEYGVDQSDSTRVRALTGEHLGAGRTIDLVLDDASHILGPTRSSFETLFPYIRPGGSYIVEDYASAHLVGSLFLKDAVNGSESAQNIFRAGMKGCTDEDLLPCHILAVEAMLAAMVDQGIVRKVVANKQWLRIIRGHKDIENPQEFNIRALACDHFGLLNCVPDDNVLRVLGS